MRLWSVPLAFGLPVIAAPCCGVGMAPVLFTGQTNIVVWDAKHGVEHFVRDAHFATSGPSLGFIAPTPSEPKLSEASKRAFENLEALNPAPAASAMKSGDTFAAAAPVEVVRVQDVAGYHATVLKATDGAALQGWLKANGYPSPAFLAKWSEPYVRRGWTFTAFKVLAQDAATGPVRMSFATKVPFNPYSVPKENGNADGVPLRVYYVSAGHEVPKIGGKASWVDAKWSAELSAEGAASLAASLNLAPDEVPEKAHVTAYQDERFGTPGLDDLYFVKADGTVPLAAGLAGGLGLLLLGLTRVSRFPLPS